MYAIRSYYAKRGFHNRNTQEIVAINVVELNRFDNDADVTVETLMEIGLIKNPKRNNFV